MKKIIFATGNEHKMVEVRMILDDLGLEILSQKEAEIQADVVEDGTTFEENALIKASEIAKIAHEMPEYKEAVVMADDSGLEVDALDGAPGVHSARYAGEPCDDAANNAKLLDALSDVEDEQRSARFVCHLVYLDEQGREYDARGTVEGRIAHEPQGDNGFGYDPLFIPDEYGAPDGKRPNTERRSYAQLTPDEKDAISHRGRAMEKLEEKLPEFLG